MIPSKQITAQLLREWKTLCVDANTIEFRKAEFMKRVLAITGDDFYGFLTDVFDIQGGSLLRMYRNMASAVEAVIDERVWKAVGWTGIKIICNVNDQKKRKLVIDEVLSSKVRSKPSVYNIVKNVAPESVKIRSTTTNGPSMSKGKIVDPIAERDILVAEFKRLLSTGYSFLAEALSSDARRVIGLQSKSVKRKSKKTAAA